VTLPLATYLGPGTSDALHLILQAQSLNSPQTIC
jgi:hypothetical protein